MRHPLCIFGFAAAAQAQQSGIGALSALLVLVAVATLLALIGAVFGPFAAGVTTILEGPWFSLCLVGALMLTRR